MNGRGRFLVNGESAAAVPADDRGLQYGDGLFETTRVQNGEPRHWQRHLDRLRRGAARLGIMCPNPEALTHEARQLCKDSACGVLKVILTRGSGERGYAVRRPETSTRILGLWEDSAPDTAKAEEGVDVRLCRTCLARNAALAGLKHLNRLEQVLARAEWNDEYAEGLMQDELGNVIEGTMSNIFLVREGVLYTPDLSYCGVAGIVRDIVMEQAKQMSIPLRCGNVSINEVHTAREIFLTNSVIGIWPVRSVEGKTYRIGTTTRALQRVIRDVESA